MRNLPLQTRRDAWVEVNLGAIERNARAIRKRIPASAQLMAIVKADAYGHGATMVIPTLEASGVSMVGVAAMDEAIQIRQAGLEIPVLVIGAVPDWAVQYASDYDIQLTIFDEHHLDLLKKANASSKKPVKVHIKVDTGMHRIGIAWDRAAAFVRACRKQPFIQVEGLFSHFADPASDTLSREQLERWQAVLSDIDPWPPYVHISNSGGALTYPDAPGNLVRMGIAFFGYGTPKNTEPPIALQPVMSVKARIMHIQEHVSPETGISYSHTYHTPKDGEARIATVPLGYADGVPRNLSNKIEALLHGRRVPQVGTITMDQMMFNITGVPQAQIGDTLTLIGEADGDRIWLDDWAGKAGTIEYELMCGLRVRLPKTYTR